MAIKDIERRLADKYPGLSPEFRAEEPAIQVAVRWVTAEDDRVCFEICNPLNDTKWDPGDPTIPTPPVHVNCRCMLQLTEETLNTEFESSEASELISLVMLTCML